MPDNDAQRPSAPAQSRGRLPSPGCLLLVTVVMCVALVGGGTTWRIQRQRAWIGFFTQLGGSVHTEPVQPRWWHDVIEKSLGAECADGLAEITMVDACGTPLRDDLLRHLRGNTRLKWLRLDGTEVADDGLQSLATLTGLRELSLRDTRITDAGLRHIAGLTELQALDLSNTQITDAGLDSLRGLRHLRHLALDGVPISGAGLRHLSGHVKLEAFWMDDSQVTDADLMHLRSLGNLQFLSLGSGSITDSGLEHLGVLTNLRGLRLRETQVTVAGARTFDGRVLRCIVSVIPANEPLDRRASVMEQVLSAREPEIFLTSWPVPWDGTSF